MLHPPPTFIVVLGSSSSQSRASQHRPACRPPPLKLGLNTGMTQFPSSAGPGCPINKRVPVKRTKETKNRRGFDAATSAESDCLKLLHEVVANFHVQLDLTDQ